MERVESEPGRDAGFHHLQNAFHDHVFVVHFDEVKIPLAARRRGLRFFALVDRVGGAHDVARFRLAMHLREPHHSHRIGVDQVRQHTTGADARELVAVPDQDHGGIRRHGAEQLVHQHDVGHRHFVDDQQIDIKWVFFGAAKPANSGIVFEQAVNRLRLAAR